MYRLVAQSQQTCADRTRPLMGHSFGCIVVSSICGGPNGTTPLAPACRFACTGTRRPFALGSCGRDSFHWGPRLYNAMMHRPGVRDLFSRRVRYTIRRWVSFIRPLSAWFCRTRALLSTPPLSSGARSARSEFKDSQARSTRRCFPNGGLSLRIG